MVNKDLAKLEHSRLTVCELNTTGRKRVNKVFITCVVDIFMYVQCQFYNAKTAMKASVIPHYYPAFEIQAAADLLKDNTSLRVREQP